MPLQLCSYAFYNMLIKPLNELKTEITTAQYQNAFETMLTIETQLGNTADWNRFPTYSALSNKLRLNQVALILCKMTLNLKQGKNIEQTKSQILKIIPMLESAAHLLNMLDATYNDPEKTKIDIVRNTAKHMGLFVEIPIHGYDCYGNHQFINQSNTKQQKIPANSDYPILIDLLNSFATPRLQKITLALFSNMETIEKESEQARSLKSVDDNMFTQGYIERLITLSNEYKIKFKALSQASSNGEAEDGNCEEFCNLLNSGLSQLR